MKLRELLKWALLAYLVTLGMGLCTSRMLPASPDNVLSNIAKCMITQFYPLLFIVPVLSVYSICVRRWQPILGGLIGNLAFFPLTIYGAIVFGFVIGLPIETWQRGNHVVVIALAIAYFALAFFLARKWIKRRRSQPATAPYSEPAARSPQG
jgi:hypothetical protein